MKTSQLILVRHGESVWNLENRFTGWQDVELSQNGISEARRAGAELKKLNLRIDIVYTSVLKRALQTHWLMLEEMDQLWVPTQKTWRLNERHYGELTGLNKSETAKLHGEEQVKLWRRSFALPPPFLKESDSRNPKNDPRYAALRPSDIPLGESLLMTVDRVMPCWNDEILPFVAAGKSVMIVAHGNSLRALIYHLEGLSPESILEVNIPTAVPMVYTLGENQKVLGKKFIGDPEAIAKAVGAVANQGKR